MMKRYPRLDEIPGSADPRWEKWTAPLKDFLFKYRCWEELSKWRKEQGIQEGVLVQFLAWLSVNKLAGCTNGEWVAYYDTSFRSSVGTERTFPKSEVVGSSPTGSTTHEGTTQ